MGLEVIEKVHQKKRAKKEKTRKKALRDISTVLELLKKDVFFEDAYLFGSVTKPFQFHEHSDIDLAFKGLDGDKLFFATGFLSRYLERDVNVVPLEDIHFKDKILKQGIKWKND